MKIITPIARFLLGLIFLVFGLNGFLHFIPATPPSGTAGQFVGALFVSHYLVPIFLLQIISAVLLLLNRYVPLALTLLAPIIVAATVDPAGRAVDPARHLSELLDAITLADQVG